MSADRLTPRDLERMAVRSSLLQATWNYERQQGLGWAWALEPALARLYPDAASRRERLAEHTAYFNTQPTLASLALGAVARLEETRVEGGDAGLGVERIKAVLGSSLAALGDKLFWFSLRPFAACLGVCLALAGSPLAAPALWLCYNAFHLGLRGLGVAWGYRRGPEVLGPELRGRLQGLTRGVSVAGTMLAGVTVAVALVPGGTPRPFDQQILLTGGLAFGLLAAQRARPSPTEWALVAGAASLLYTWVRT